jgi:hypothetical protein
MSEPEKKSKPKKTRSPVRYGYSSDIDRTGLLPSGPTLSPKKNLSLSPLQKTRATPVSIYSIPFKLKVVGRHKTLSILLIQPKLKMFEIVLVDVVRENTLGDILVKARQTATDARLSDQTYIGLCNEDSDIEDLATPIFRIIKWEEKSKKKKGISPDRKKSVSGGKEVKRQRQFSEATGSSGVVRREICVDPIDQLSMDNETGFRKKLSAKEKMDRLIDSSDGSASGSSSRKSRSSSHKKHKKKHSHHEEETFDSSGVGRNEIRVDPVDRLSADDGSLKDTGSRKSLSSSHKKRENLSAKEKMDNLVGLADASVISSDSRKSRSSSHKKKKDSSKHKAADRSVSGGSDARKGHSSSHKKRSAKNNDSLDGKSVSSSGSKKSRSSSHKSVDSSGSKKSRSSSHKKREKKLSKENGTEKTECDRDASPPTELSRRGLTYRTDEQKKKDMEKRLFVAMPQGYTGAECRKIRRMLWKNPKLQRWWRQTDQYRRTQEQF